MLVWFLQIFSYEFLFHAADGGCRILHLSKQDPLFPPNNINGIHLPYVYATTTLTLG